MGEGDELVEIAKTSLVLGQNDKVIGTAAARAAYLCPGQQLIGVREQLRALDPKKAQFIQKDARGDGGIIIGAMMVKAA